MHLILHLLQRPLLYLWHSGQKARMKRPWPSGPRSLQTVFFSNRVSYIPKKFSFAQIDWLNVTYCRICIGNLLSSWSFRNIRCWRLVINSLSHRFQSLILFIIILLVYYRFADDFAPMYWIDSQRMERKSPFYCANI